MIERLMTMNFDMQHEDLGPITFVQMMTLDWCCSNDDPWLMFLFYGKIDFSRLGFSMGKKEKQCIFLFLL